MNILYIYNRVILLFNENFYKRCSGFLESRYVIFLNIQIVYYIEFYFIWEGVLKNSGNKVFVSDFFIINCIGKFKIKFFVYNV